MSYFIPYFFTQNGKTRKCFKTEVSIGFFIFIFYFLDLTILLDLLVFYFPQFISCVTVIRVIPSPELKPS